MDKPSLSQATHVLEMIKKKDLEGPRLQTLFQSGLLSDLFDANPDCIDRDKFREACGLNPHLVTLSSVRMAASSVEELIREGRLDFINEVVRNRLIKAGSVPGNLSRDLPHDIVLLRYKDGISTEAVRMDFSRRDYRPIYVIELAAIARFLVRGHGYGNVAALGGVTDDFYPCLFEYHKERRLGLTVGENGWPKGIVFGAVKR